MTEKELRDIIAIDESYRIERIVSFQATVKDAETLEAKNIRSNCLKTCNLTCDLTCNPTCRI